LGPHFAVAGVNDIKFLAGLGVDPFAVDEGLGLEDVGVVELEVVSLGNQTVLSSRHDVDVA